MTKDTVPRPPPLPIHCAVCEKEIFSAGSPCSLTGMVFRVTLGGDIGPEQEEYVHKQFGPYSSKRDYEVCAECFLRALGVPEPEKEEAASEEDLCMVQ